MAVEPFPNLPTPKIADHELLRCIGKGSFGQVWLARNVMGEYRAVKIVYRAAFETDRPLTQEFEAIKKYEPKSRSHPSLLNILHVGRNTADEYFYYIMELADNQTTEQPLDAARYEAKTLLSEFKSKKRLPVDECFQIGLALTEALDYLHQNRLVHRDIKLSNVIFVGGRPQLADVGLVTNIDGTKSLVGTEGYMPPEGPGSVQADVYALGKVLYEISTGNSRLDFPTIPLVGTNETERKQFLALNDVFLKACNHDLKKRYKTAKEMHEALVAVRDDRKPKQKFNTQKIILGVALAAVVGFIGYKYIISHRTPPPPPSPFAHILVAGPLDKTYWGWYAVQYPALIKNTGAAGTLTVNCVFSQDGQDWTKSESRYFQAGQEQTFTFYCDDVSRWGGDVVPSIH